MSKAPISQEKLKMRLERQFWQYCYAAYSISRAFQTINNYAMLSKNEQSAMQYTFASSAVVSYGMPFTTSNTLGKLPGRFPEFSDSKLRADHETILELRNMIYAHVDSTFEHYSVEFHVKREAGKLEYGSEIAFLDLMECSFPSVVDLCRFQLDRLKVETDKLMRIILPEENAERMLRAEQSNATSFKVHWPTAV